MIKEVVESLLMVSLLSVNKKELIYFMLFLNLK